MCFVHCPQELDEYEDPEELCAAAGLPLRRISARVVEVMLYNHEADHLLVKLLEYGDLLEKLVVVEARMDFNFEQKPLGMALVKYLPALRRWLHVLDHGQVECYDESSRGSSERVSARKGSHPFAWGQDNFGRAAINSEKFYNVTLCKKYTRALTSENLCLVCSRSPPPAQPDA